MKPTFYTVAQHTVPLEPFGKARPRVTKNGTFMPREYEANKQALQWMFPRFDVPELVRLTVVAVRPMPKGWSKKKREVMNGRYATPKPDSDNILGSVMDSLFPEDDDIVVETAVRKIWGEEAALHIKIEGISYEQNVYAGAIQGGV